MTPEHVKALRERLGLSQRELALELNRLDPRLKASPTTVSRWETGNRTPNYHMQDLLERLAQTGQEQGR